jgi:DNA-binding GntR family transcriptional regulator
MVAVKAWWLGMIDQMDSTQRVDRVADLVSHLRQLIISGEIPPGSPLRQEDLAMSFDASRMPVREALRTLSAEGLVHLRPNRGAIVAPIDPDEMREIVEMREAAEVLAIRLAIPHLSNAQIDAAARIHRQIEDTDAKRFGQLNKAFHMALYSPSNRPRLMAHISALLDAAERYLQFALIPLDYVGTSADEHQAILGACYARDVDEAARLISDHILHAGKSLESYLRNRGADETAHPRRRPGNTTGARGVAQLLQPPGPRSVE